MAKKMIYVYDKQEKFLSKHKTLQETANAVGLSVGGVYKALKSGISNNKTGYRFKYVYESGEKTLDDVLREMKEKSYTKSYGQYMAEMRTK